MKLSMRNFQTNAKDYVAYKKEVDYSPESVRKGPEFKCFICGKWNDNMKYFLDKKWYPQSDLKYNMNFLCDPKCATEAGKKYDRYLET